MEEKDQAKNLPTEATQLNVHLSFQENTPFAKVPATWQISDLILDRYEVTAQLGKGGMGIVYKVHDRVWNTHLAVKSPRPEIFTREDGRENFLREADTWVHLEPHPHIVQCMFVLVLGYIPRIFAQLIAAFRSAAPTKTQLNAMQQAKLADVLLTDGKASARSHPRSIEGYVLLAEHHTDPFLDCTIYLGEGETIKEPVWIKEYEQVFASPEQRAKREQLVLRHADVLYRFPQHQHIVEYRTSKATDSHLYVVLARKPGIFLSELLTNESPKLNAEEELKHLAFALNARLQILGGLLSALDYLAQQPGFKQSAYRDLRPDSIFVQYTSSGPISQLFNFDCTKLPGATTRLGHLKEGQKRYPTWDEYASPELLEYVESGPNTPDIPISFTGDIRSDIYSWGIIAWELLTGVLPFKNSVAKMVDSRKPWPAQLAPDLRRADNTLALETIQLIEACLDSVPANRPALAALRRRFPAQ